MQNETQHDSAEISTDDAIDDSQYGVEEMYEGDDGYFSDVTSGGAENAHVVGVEGENVIVNCKVCSSTLEL